MSPSPQDKNVSDSQPDIQLKMTAQRIGTVGTYLGTRENAVLYLASFIVIVDLLLLGTLMVIDETLRPDILKIVGAIGLASIGFIGGLLSK